MSKAQDNKWKKEDLYPKRKGDGSTNETKGKNCPSGKSKKNRSNKKDKTSDNRSNDSRPSTGNDISWYGSKELIDQAAKLYFSEVLDDGFEIDLGIGTLTPNLGAEKLCTPGVCALEIAPTLGITQNNPALSPCNTALRMNYSFVRYVNSGHANYDATDLGYYYLAADSAYMLWNTLVRGYRILYNYEYFNKYTPFNVLAASGIHPQAIDHANDLLNLINRFGAALSSMAVPNTINYFFRHDYMFRSVFKDSDISKSQFYIFRPKGFYVLSADETKLELKTMPSVYVRWKTWLEGVTNLINLMLQRIQGHESMGIMSGDVLKAYGSDKIVKLPVIAEGEALQPTYDPIILTQINNATVHPTPDLNDFTITQDADGNLNQPIGGNIDLASAIINLPYGSVTPDDIIYATRLMSLKDKVSGEVVLPSELVTSIEVFANPVLCPLDNLDSAAYGPKLTIDNTIQRIVDTSSTTLYNITKYATAFRYFPNLLYVSVDNTGSTKYEDICTNVNYENFTTVTGTDLSKINYVTNSGLWGVPVKLTEK